MPTVTSTCRHKDEKGNVWQVQAFGRGARHEHASLAMRYRPHKAGLRGKCDGLMVTNKTTTLDP